MKKLVLIASILGALSSVPARADEWVQLNNNKNSSKGVFIRQDDIRAIKANDNTPSFWLKLEDPSDKTTMLVLTQADCRNKAIRHTYMVTKKQGIEVDKGDMSGKWEPVVPEGHLQIIFSRVCTAT